MRGGFRMLPTAVTNIAIVTPDRPSPVATGGRSCPSPVLISEGWPGAGGAGPAGQSRIHGADDFDPSTSPPRDFVIAALPAVETDRFQCHEQPARRTAPWKVLAQGAPASRIRRLRKIVLGSSCSHTVRSISRRRADRGATPATSCAAAPGPRSLGACLATNPRDGVISPAHHHRADLVDLTAAARWTDS